MTNLRTPRTQVQGPRQIKDSRTGPRQSLNRTLFGKVSAKILTDVRDVGRCFGLINRGTSCAVVSVQVQTCSRACRFSYCVLNIRILCVFISWQYPYNVKQYLNPYNNTVLNIRVLCVYNNNCDPPSTGDPTIKCGPPG